MTALEFVNAVSDALSWGMVDSIERDVTSDTRKIIRNANLVLRSVQADDSWQVLRRKYKIMVQAPVSSNADGIAITKGSTTMTFTNSDTSPNAEWVGALIKISGYDTTYRVMRFNGASTIELDKAWRHSTISGAGSFSLGRDQYQLPEDYDRYKGKIAQNLSTGTELDLVDENEVRKDFTEELTPQEPTAFTVFGVSPKGRRVLHLNFVPDDNYVIEITYQANHPELREDTDEVLYPPRLHLFLVDTIKARLDRDAENKAQAQQVANDALADRIRQESVPEPGSSRMQATPSYRKANFRRRR